MVSALLRRALVTHRSYERVVHVIEKLFLSIMNLIHVIPSPARPAAHGCTAASGFGFSAEPSSGAVDGWMEEQQSGPWQRGRHVGFAHMVWKCLYTHVGIRVQWQRKLISYNYMFLCKWRIPELRSQIYVINTFTDECPSLRRGFEISWGLHLG